MGRACGVSRRRKKTKSFQYKSKNKLRRQRQRELRKCGPINCDIVRESWNPKKSLKNNMKNMGLAENPNKLLSGPKFYEKFKNPNLDDDKSNNIVLQIHERLKKNKLKKSNQFNIEINKNQEPRTAAEKLFEEALKPSHKNFRLSPKQIKFCCDLIKKYDNDYEAMQRDKMNYYQLSVGQLRSLIKNFMITVLRNKKDYYE